MTFSRNPESFTHGLAFALPSRTRGGSRMRELRPYGSVRGAVSNDRPYRDKVTTAAPGRFFLATDDRLRRLPEAVMLSPVRRMAKLPEVG